MEYSISRFCKDKQLFRLFLVQDLQKQLQYNPLSIIWIHVVYTYENVESIFKVENALFWS